MCQADSVPGSHVCCPTEDLPPHPVGTRSRGGVRLQARVQKAGCPQPGWSGTWVGAQGSPALRERLLCSWREGQAPSLLWARGSPSSGLRIWGLKRSEQAVVCKRVQTEGQADLRLQGFGPLVREKCQPESRTGGRCKAGLRVRGEKSGHVPGFREGKFDRPCSRGHCQHSVCPRRPAGLGLWQLVPCEPLRTRTRRCWKLRSVSEPTVIPALSPASRVAGGDGLTLPQALGPVVWGLRLATVTLLGSQGPCVPHLRARPPCPLPGEPVSVTVSAH